MNYGNYGNYGTRRPGYDNYGRDNYGEYGNYGNYGENYGEYGYEDYELTDYILRIRPLNSSTTTKVWSLPNDVFDESHDFVSYGTTLAAGTLGRPLQNQRMCPSMSFRMHSAMIPLLPHRYIWLRLMLLLLIG